LPLTNYPRIPEIVQVFNFCYFQNKLILASTRNRKQTRRFGGNSDDQEIFAEIGSDSDDSAEYDSDGNEGSGRKGKFRSRAGGLGGGQRKGWTRKDCFKIEKCLLTFG